MVDKKTLSIVIADDHPMLLSGLYKELTLHEYHVIGQATNGMQALELVLTLKPTLAILDINMPMLTGFEVIKMAKAKKADTKFMLMSFNREAEYIAQAKALQISGYLLKEDSFFEIERCIETVLKGDTFFSRSFESVSLQNANEELKKLKFLTPSEIVILKLIAQQTPNIDISETLAVSVRTIEKHRSNIMSKLGIESGNNALTNWTLTNKSLILSL